MPSRKAMTVDHVSSVAAAVIVAKKRSFTQKLAIQRQVYHEMTSFRQFPLQEMAIRDVEENLKDYLSAAAAVSGSGGQVVTRHTESDDSDDDQDGNQRRKESAAAADQKHQNSQAEQLLREKFINEFLQEKSLRVVVMTSNNIDKSIYPANNNGDAPTLTLTQEIESALPLLDAFIESHGNGHVTADLSSDRKSSYNSENKATCSQTSDKENIYLDNKADQSKNERTVLELNQGRLNNNGLTKNSIFITDDDDGCAENAQNTSHLPILWSFEPRLFAMETAIRGKRRYISAHLGRFVDHYWRECDVNNRHYYELIRENTPCRLYFDLEFDKLFNPHLTTTITESLLTELFDEIHYQFQHLYSISLQRSDMVDLDSSTSKKFSRHWILHLPGGLLFDDARAAGIFVKAMVSRLEKERESGELQAKGRELLAKNLFLKAEVPTNQNANPKLTCLIDLGVYTRNRLFRLLGSKKFGKTCDAALRIAASNEYRFPKRFDNTRFYLPEMIVGETPTATVSQENAASFEKFCNSMSWEAHAEALAATLVVPANSEKMKFPTLTHPAKLLTDGVQKQQLVFATRCGGLEKVKRETPEYGESPFPKLDNFIVNNLGRRDKLVGSIGTWSLDTQHPLPQSIAYNMRDNRFCENVGRAHKSNNIIWNVHLINRVCWQTCHDPECRGAKFRGKVIDLPEDVNIEIDEYFLEHELSMLNEGMAVGGNNEKEEKTLPNEGKEICADTDKDDEAYYDDPQLEKAMLQLNISDVLHNLVKADEVISSPKDEEEEEADTDSKQAAVEP